MATEYLQSATRRVLLKVFLTTDHVTEATGRTVAVTISKNGAAFANPNAGATNATEIGSGWYYVDLNVTDTATLGPIIVRGIATSCDPSEAYADVVKATNRGMTALPDFACSVTGASLLTGGTGSNQLNASGGTLVTIPSIPAGWLTATGIAAAALNGKGDWAKVVDLATDYQQRGSAVTLPTNPPADFLNAAAFKADALTALALAIWSQAMTQVASVPGVTGTVLQALEWLFVLARNKITETSGLQTVRNAADSATIGTSAVSDDGTTFTRGAYS